MYGENVSVMCGSEQLQSSTDSQSVSRRLCRQLVSNSWQTVADHVKSTQFTVKDLRPNTVYLFIIRAVNAQGLGDPSPMSDPVRTKGTSPRPHP